jgi:hypothetical protein
MKLLKGLNRILLYLLPEGILFDRLYAFFLFIRKNKRLPNQLFLNDALYRLKVDGSLNNKLRRLTSDKEYVKNYIRELVGDQYNVPTKAVLKTKEDILSFAFKKGDVVKPTHASGYVKFIKEEPVDYDGLVGWLDINYYKKTREANYRFLDPKLIVEPPVFGRHNVDDIKFFTYKGNVRIIQVDMDRHTNHSQMLYDRTWLPLMASILCPLSKKIKSKPKHLNDMIQVVEQLAKPFGFVRVDLYYDEGSGQFFVGEITHCHNSAGGIFNSSESEKLVSEILFQNRKKSEI